MNTINPLAPAAIRAGISDSAYLTIPGTRFRIGFGFSRITPEMASRIAGQNYRHLRDHRVAFYARQMLGGYWKTTPQGITFDEFGNRIDGDHRLTSVINSNVAVTFLVTWGWSSDIVDVLDINIPRHPVDYMRTVIGGTWTNRLVGALRFLAAGRKLHGSTEMLPNSVLADAFLLIGDNIRAADEMVGKGIARSEVVAAIASALYRHPADVVSRFVIGLNTGMGMDNNHEQTALAARNAILASRGCNTIEAVYRNIATIGMAIDAFAAKRLLKIIRPPIYTTSHGTRLCDPERWLTLPTGVKKEMEVLLSKMVTPETE